MVEATGWRRTLSRWSRAPALIEARCIRSDGRDTTAHRLAVAILESIRTHGGQRAVESWRCQLFEEPLEPEDGEPVYEFCVDGDGN